ncbi:Chromo domain-containing protein [Cynara cardunculus var. scolymus]|uniref:peptidylprolyl isomerase n=1 Tax=Cynara cardunculus var. scolymus TaxID=59895 RepID=A0A118JS78_CYNCS|nr:Chromo domain-containing protein [Cynara cardunculus var. scolymus]
MVEENKRRKISDMAEDPDSDEEPGEVIESAPPLRVGEERVFNSTGLKKKLLRRGVGFETPECGDEPTANNNFLFRLFEWIQFIMWGLCLMGLHLSPLEIKGNPSPSRLDKIFFSTENTSPNPLFFSPPFLTFSSLKKIFISKANPKNQVCSGFDQAVLTMKKGEIALFTLPPQLGFGAAGTDGVPPNSFIYFEVELISWITVVDVCKDGGILKRVVKKGEQTGQPGDLDEVKVRYVVTLLDGVTVAESPNEGVEFYLKDGHFCMALPKAIKTMTREEKADLIVQPQYAFGGGVTTLPNGCSPIPPDSALRVALELLSFKPVVDVTNDLKVVKKILKEGEGALTANEGASVIIRYRAMLENGTVFEKKGYDGETSLSFITDEEQVIAGLDRAVATMKKGEKATLTIGHEYGYGSKEVMCDLAVIPPFSTLVYEVEVIDFEKVTYQQRSPHIPLVLPPKLELDDKDLPSPKEIYAVRTVVQDGKSVEQWLIRWQGQSREEAMWEDANNICTVDVRLCLPNSHDCLSHLVTTCQEKAPWEMANHERIEEAGKKKEEGNVLFKNGKYQRAAKKYDKAVDYVSEEGLLGDDVQKLVKSLRVSCWLNGAACSLKLNDYQEAIKLCSKAVSLDYFGRQQAFCCCLSYSKFCCCCLLAARVQAKDSIRFAALEHYTRIFMLKFQQVLDVEFYNVKALYRRAQAYMKTYDLQLAELDIKKALEADPQSREVKSIQTTLKQLQAESNKRDLKLYTNMFARMAKDCSLGTTKRPKLEKVDKDQRDGIMEMELEKVDSEMAVDSSS